MKVSMKKSVKTFLAIMFSAILALGTFSVALAGLEVDNAGGNVDEIIFGTQTKEDGYIGTAMPESIAEGSSETDYYIESLEQFKNFQKLSKTNNFAGKKVHLAANVSLNDNEFVGIGTAEKPFAGTFDGHGYAVTKLSTSLFVAVDGATIQKLVIGGAKTTTGVLAATANAVEVEEVVISRSKVTADSYAGGMFGSVEGNSSISDSTVRRLVITANGEAAGFAVDDEVTMNNCAVVNSYINGTFVNGN